MRFKKMKRFGYTLAEVIVTLGIVGVISAFAIPSLVNEYNKQVYAKTLQVAISDFENAMQAMMMKEGVFSILETNAWKHILNNIYYQSGVPYYSLNSYTSPPKVINGFTTEISKTLPIEEVAPYEYHVGAKWKLDGREASSPYSETDVRTYTKKFGYYYSIATPVNQYKPGRPVLRLVIDVNGKKPPNYLGKDVFVYEMTNEGILYPAYVDLENNLILRRPMYEKPATLENLREMCTSLNSELCSAYLMENGFKIDY